MRQQNSISTSSKHGCFQLQWPLIQLVPSIQAAAVTYLSLQRVRKGLYEQSGAAIFLDRKSLENKELCVWYAGVSCTRSCFLEHTSAFTSPSTSQPFPSPQHPPYTLLFSSPWFARTHPGKLHTYCLLLWAKCLIAFISRKTLFPILPSPLFFQYLHYPFSIHYDSLLTWDHWLPLPPPCPGTPYINHWDCWTKKTLKTKQKINMYRFIAAFIFSMHRQINIMEIRSLCSAFPSTVHYDKKIPVLRKKKRKKDWLNSAIVQSQDPEERGLLK